MLVARAQLSTSTLAYMPCLNGNAEAAALTAGLFAGTAALALSPAGDGKAKQRGAARRTERTDRHIRLPPLNYRSAEIFVLQLSRNETERFGLYSVVPRILPIQSRMREDFRQVLTPF